MSERSTTRQGAVRRPERNSEPGLLTTAELAIKLRCSVRTLEGWRRRGVGPRFLRIEGRVLYRENVVEDYVAAAVREFVITTPTL